MNALEFRGENPLKTRSNRKTIHGSNVGGLDRAYIVFRSRIGFERPKPEIERRPKSERVSGAENRTSNGVRSMNSRGLSPEWKYDLTGVSESTTAVRAECGSGVSA